MAINTVLSAGVTNSLLSLQGTQAAIDQTQNRLATGRRVNSALDNAASYFTAKGLSNRASDLNNLQDAIGLATKVLDAASKGLDAISTLIDSAKGLANQAKQTTDTTTRAALATQFGTIRAQIDKIAADSSFNGTNLLKATPDTLNVKFNETGTSALAIAGVDTTTGASGLNIAAAAGSWATDANVDAAISDLNTATATVRSTASSLGANGTIVKARQEFTTGLIQTLNAGADVLTLADSNQEGANLLALQTRQQLGVSALSLASQSDQAVLKLFR